MTVKETPTEYPIAEVIAKRWSPRAFAETPVTDEEFNSLLEAARWAPSAFNEQPWRFLVAKKEDALGFEQMLSCLAEGNQAWAKHAAALMIVVARMTLTRNDKPNKHAWYDTGQAVATLSIQASSMGLYLHQMAGFSVDAARKAYGIPDGYEPVVAIALGHLGDPTRLSEQLQVREAAARSRKPITVTTGTSWLDRF